MSRGSTLRRAAQRIAGHPVGKKEKLRIATFGLVKIALGDTNPQLTAIDTLRILGIKPKSKDEVKAQEIVNG